MERAPRLAYAVGFVGLLSMLVAPECPAQGARGLRGLHDRFPAAHAAGASRARDWQARLASMQARSKRWQIDPALDQFPVVVYPAGRGFHSLQAALDFAGGSQLLAASTVILQPGTYVGNFTLPTSGITVVGVGGELATTIEGQTGVAQPAIRYAPSGGATLSYAWLNGLRIVGRQVAAVEYAGTTAYAQLWLDHCTIETRGPIPAITAAGGGFAPGKEMALDLHHSRVISKGDGMVASIGADTFVFSGWSWIQALGTGIDVTSSSTSGTALDFYLGAIEASPSLIVDGLGHVWSGMSYLESDQSVVEISNSLESRIERGEVHSQAGDCITLSGAGFFAMEYVQVTTDGPAGIGLQVLNSSQAEVAYCGFNASVVGNAIFVDPSSSKMTVYNHYRFSVLP